MRYTIDSDGIESSIHITQISTDLAAQIMSMLNDSVKILDREKEQEKQILHLYYNEGKLAAVKYLKAESNLDLKQAKDKVEALVDKYESFRK